MKSIFTALFLVLCGTVYSQNFNIKGVVEDTLGNSLISSTVLLLEKSDSTMVKFTRTELDGSFVFRKVPAGNYIVKSTYIGYIPLMITVSSDGKNVDLGKMKMNEIAEELMQVVIKAAKAPIKMRGDTIEYDASTFQVPEGSSVEELLRQLPGIDVEQDGSLTADGKDVDRVTVDGKKFFGNDPKAATQNLPAEGISKVQVFDSKSESEKITGATTESETKTMNLELKEDFKKGGFGKVTGGVGTINRAELKGNYNRFNKKIQLSVVGVGNNTGRNGLGWDDYQDFMGSQAFNFSDDGDFGFGGGGGMRFYTFGGSGNSLESDIQSIFFSDGNAGFPENYNGGVNFNYSGDKTDISSVYYYNFSGLTNTTTVDRTSFLQGEDFQRLSERNNDDQSSGHRAEFSIDQEIDSLSSFRVEVNGAYINEFNQYDSELSLNRGANKVSETSFDNDLRSNGYLVNTVAFYRKKFKKKGRRFGLSGTYLNTSLLDLGNQLSNSSFYSGGVVDSVSTINQNTNNDQGKIQYKANAVFVEPIGKKFFSQTFYNFSSRLETGDRTVEDIDGDIKTLNAQLSRTYDNTISYHRAGTAVRYFHDGLNISLGGGVQMFNLQGSFNSKVDPNLSGTVDKQFLVWVPHFSLNKSFGRNSRLGISYDLGATEPAIQQLQPIVDNTNPLYITEGNPDLTPEISHGISGRINRFWPISQVRLYANFRYSYYTNDIINSETVDENLVTYVKPVNFDGGNRTSVYMGGSFPIYKRKLKGNANIGYTVGNNFAYVNSFLNKTNTVRYSPGLSITWTPTKEISLRTGGDFSIVDTEYDINTTQNQRTINNSFNTTFKSPLFAKVYLNTSLRYTQIINERFNVNETIPIWNASIYRHFLPGNKLEVRVSIYDALNRNVQINQTAFGNSVSKSSTTTLGRYLMLTMTYNIKGLQSDANRGGFFH